MPLLKELLTLLPNLASLCFGSIADLVFPTHPNPLLGSPADHVARTQFPLKGPFPPLSALFLTPMDINLPKLLGHLIATTKHIKRFHNFCIMASPSLPSLDRSIVHAEYLELCVDLSPCLLPGYVPLVTATGLTSLVLRFRKKMLGDLIHGGMGQGVEGTWPVLRSLVLTGAMIRAAVLRQWFERHADPLRTLEVSDVSFLGVEDFEDVFGGLRGRGQAGLSGGPGGLLVGSGKENPGGWVGRSGVETLTLRNICKRARGAEAMHVVDSYSGALAPGEVEELGRRVLRFLRGERWRGVSLGGWLECDEADEDGEGEEDGDGDGHHEGADDHSEGDDADAEGGDDETDIGDVQRDDDVDGEGVEGGVIG